MFSESFRYFRDLHRVAEQERLAQKYQNEKAAKRRDRSRATSKRKVVKSNNKPSKPCWLTTLPLFRSVVRWKQEIDSARTIRATTQECPNPECKARIEKDGGCDLVRCTLCQKEFIWARSDGLYEYRANTSMEAVCGGSRDGN
ncbi:hypothetical protein PG993_011942 [Apiospora rasikravindrae]|uniref:IBR domain-containing protein n=1 Tax=Apiospora rasikravindrae TaxID=990691 RepID=A0ABR1S109_9PEZI